MKGAADGELGGASGDQEWRGEGGGDHGGGQRVKMGERAALILGSGVHQDGFHQ